MTDAVFLKFNRIVFGDNAKPVVRGVAWLELAGIEAIESLYAASDGKEIGSAVFVCGVEHYVSVTPDEVMAKMTEAIKRFTNTPPFVPRAEREVNIISHGAADQPRG